MLEIHVQGNTTPLLLLSTNCLKDDTKMGLYNPYYNENYPIKSLEVNPSCHNL